MDTPPASSSWFSVSVQLEIHQACLEFEEAWRQGQRPEVEDWWSEWPEAGKDILLRELLLVEVEYRRRAGDTISSAEYRRRFPDHLDVVDQVLEADPPSTCSDDAMSSAPFPPPPEEPVRFRIVDFHTRGGLGKISRAMDRQFNREVAVKELLEQHASNVHSRRRFELEAGVTGCLEHPGIVPIYGMGRHPDGTPFYAMRLIRGSSLEEAAKELARHRGNVREHELERRRLLTRFISVCQTVHYAHSRGVIHRDLKPANIMLGPYGETLVLDWGLAYLVEGEPGEIHVPPRPHTQVVTETPGTIAGTPAFMSPEQAAGATDRFGPATDVYGLGATLYTLLTGRAPFEGKSTREILESVRRGHFPTPRQIDAGVPRPLEAVCRKAMSLEPADRYDSAQSLADDVERFLSDERVTAYREPPWTQLGRWARRHRTAAAASGVLLVALVIGLLAGTVLLRQTNRQIDAQRIQALNTLRIARAAVDDLLTNVSEEELLNEPGMHPLRARLLERALSYYRDFSDNVRDHPSLRAEFSVELAESVQRMAEITNEIGTRSEAIVLAREAVQLRRELCEGPDAELSDIRQLAESHKFLGNLYIEENELQLANEQFREGRQLLERQLQLRDDPGLRNLLGGMIGQLAYVEWYTDPAGALDIYSRALEIREKVVAEHGENPQYRADLAKILNNVAILQLELGDSEAAVTTILRTQTLWQSLVEQEPRRPGYRVELGKSLGNLGNFYLEMKQLHEAERVLTEAGRIFKSLVDDYPTVISYRTNHARLATNIADLMKTTGEMEEAFAVYSTAYDELVEVLRLNPSTWDARFQLAAVCNSLGLVRSEQEQYEEAAEHFREGRDQIEPLIEYDPTNLYNRDALVLLLNGLAGCYDELEQADLALETWISAVELQRGIVDQSPEAPERQELLSLMLSNLSDEYLQHDRLADAAGVAEDRASRWADDAVELAEAARELARCAARDAADPAYADRSLEILRAALEAGLSQELETNWYDDPAWRVLVEREAFQELRETFD